MDYTKYIDSVVGNIARKIEDEFNEKDHPRDKGGKFTSAGKEGRKASGFYGGEKVKQEDPKKGDALNEHAVKLEKAGADPKEIHRLNREGDLDGMKQLLEETETEKAAREELGEELVQVKRAAKVSRRFKSSGIDLASAMEDLGIPTEGVPEAYLESVFEGSLSEDPKLLRQAEDYIERYESGEMEDAAPKKNRLGRNPLEKIDNSEMGESGVGSIIKKTDDK